MDLLLSCSPTLTFLQGGIRGSFDQVSLRGGGMLAVHISVQSLTKKGGYYFSENNVTFL